MRSASKIALILGLVAAQAAWAQWPDYKMAGVPRDASGKPNMDGPTPKAADGHPDLSGVWGAGRAPAPAAGAAGGRGGNAGGGAGRGGNGGGRGNGGANAAPANAAPAQPQTVAQSATCIGAQRGGVADGRGYATFGDVGAGLVGGVPMTEKAIALMKMRIAGNCKDNPDAHCLPIGLMQLHTHPQPRKIVQTPGLTIIMYEAQAGIRQIFTDGRKLPPADAQPWWYGYSVGHWEGDTLVVETTGFRDDVWLDVYGTPLTNAGKMTERFHRPNYGTLDIEITFEDPTMFTKPFTVRTQQRVMPDTDLIEFICDENERSDAHLVGN